MDRDSHRSALILVGWIRIGSGRTKMIHKKVKKLCFKVLRVADPGCLSRIPDPTFFHPRSWIRTVSIPDPGSSSKNLSILTPKKAKKWFLSSKKYDPVCSSRIPDPDADFLLSRIPDPGVKKAPNPGSRIRFRNTASSASAGCSLVWAEGFFCGLYVLHGGLARISIAFFDQNMIFFSCKVVKNCHQNPGAGCGLWIRIRVKPIRIHKTTTLVVMVSGRFHSYASY